ncbi:MAG: FMN-binding protein [Alistipes finegoldii]
MTAVLFGITLVASAGGRREHDHGGTDRSGRAGGKTAALNGVLPAFDETTETLTIDEMPITVYTATGRPAGGYAVESMTKNGFGGAISMMVGFTPDGEVINVNVLKQAETPGLGTKMADADNVLLRSVKGQKLEEEARDGKLAVARTAATSMR